MQRVLIAIIFSCLCSLSAFADSGAADELQRLLQQAQGFSAQFHQRVQSEDGELLQESSGSIAVQRPYRMRWETLEPFRYLVITDGETLWRYDPDLEQLNTEPFTEDLAQTPAMVLVTAAQTLAEQFEVSRQQGDSVYVLHPKTESSFRELRLRFEGDLLQAMQLQDHLGQQTDISLQGMAQNPQFEPDHFQFIAPASPFSGELMP